MNQLYNVKICFICSLCALFTLYYVTFVTWLDFDMDYNNIVILKLSAYMGLWDHNLDFSGSKTLQNVKLLLLLQGLNGLHIKLESLSAHTTIIPKIRTLFRPSLDYKPHWSQRLVCHVLVTQVTSSALVRLVYLGSRQMSNGDVTSAGKTHANATVLTFNFILPQKPSRQLSSQQTSSYFFYQLLWHRNWRAALHSGSYSSSLTFSSKRSPRCHPIAPGGYC